MNDVEAGSVFAERFRSFVPHQLNFLSCFVFGDFLTALTPLFSVISKQIRFLEMAG